MELRSEERKLRKSDSDPLHADVYYWDRCSKKTLTDIMDEYGELLLNDGMSCFGFASHISKDEIYIGTYKITNIFTADPQRYHQMLADLSIPYEDCIKTVWENFSSENPGEIKRIQIRGKDVYDLIEELQGKGLYWAERRER